MGSNQWTKTDFTRFGLMGWKYEASSGWWVYKQCSFGKYRTWSCRKQQDGRKYCYVLPSLIHLVRETVLLHECYITMKTEGNICNILGNSCYIRTILDDKNTAHIDVMIWKKDILINYREAVSLHCKMCYVGSRSTFAGNF